MTKIVKDENTIYMVEEIPNDISIYEKAKIIVNFCDKEIKLFEKELDRAIYEIFERNGINIPTSNKSVLKKAFEVLKANNKDIEINDMYTQTYMGCIRIKKTKLFNVYMEYDNGKEYLQVGVEIKEVSL